MPRLQHPTRKKSWLGNLRASSAGLTLRQLSTDNSGGDGGGGNSGVRWTSSMTAQNNSCKAGSSYRGSHSHIRRTGNIRICIPDIQTRLRLPQRQL